MTLSISTATFAAFLLALVRASAWVAVCPPFSSRVVPSQVKIGLSVALALSVAPRPAATARALEGNGEFIFAIVREASIGLGLGFAVLLIFSAVQAAGSMIDLFGGFTLSQAYDPLLQNQASVFGRLYGQVATALLFTFGGHLLLVRGFLRTFEITDKMTAQGASLLAISGITRLMLAALEVAAPLLGALFLTEVVLGLLSRSAPQLNALQLGFPLKILLTITLAGIALPLLPDTVRTLVTSGVTGGLRLVGG